MPTNTLEARWEERDVQTVLGALCWGTLSTGEEKDLHGHLPHVITLHWMIAECCRGTQACNLLVATIYPHLLTLVVRQPVGRVTQSGMLTGEGGWKTQL